MVGLKSILMRFPRLPQVRPMQDVKSGSTDSWHGGFDFSIGICSSMHAELCGTLIGLQLACDKGYKQVILQLDSKIVVDLMAWRLWFQYWHLLIHVLSFGVT